MNIKGLLAGAVALGLMAPAAADAQELRIGFMSTLSGGAAILGEELRRGWHLGLEHQGWTENGDELGGVPTRIMEGDDQRQPEVAVELVNRWIREDRVHIVGGILWSNLLMAVRNPAVNSRTILMSMNAGASPMAGRLCSRYFISTSWENAQWPESMGQLMNDEGLETAYIMVPNYQAGKDNVDGFKRRFDGEVVGESLYPLGARDFQAEIARVREADPQALFVFAPGGMGISFVKQWGSSGLADQIRLYTVFTVDWLTLGPIGADALGSYHVNFWNGDLENEANGRFVRDFVAAHGRHPSHFAAQSYDAAALIAAAVREVNGQVDDTMALMRAMRRVDFPTVRGEISFNVNGMPIQNFYRRSVVAGAEGRPEIRTTGIVYADYPDSYVDECPARERIR